MGEFLESDKTRVLLFSGIVLPVITLAACGVNAAGDEYLTTSSITLSSYLENGTQIAFTVTKTGSTAGTVRESRWREGKDPTTDEPDTEETTRIYNIRAKSDGTQLAGKARVMFKDPIVIFRLNRSKEQVLGKRIDSPTITVMVKGTALGLKDTTTVYIITEKEQGNLREFLKRARFPSMATKN